jgi:carboxymethylenebutenolidase
MHETAELHVDNLRAVLCRPEAGATAGLLLLPMIYGIEHQVLAYADWLADAGLAAVVWDPYTGREVPTGTPEDLGPLAGSLQDGAVRAQQERWLAYMRQDLGLASLGVIGWCMGGRYALLLAAHSREVAACVAYYPSIVDVPPANQPEDAVALSGEIRCPVQVIYPGRDHVTSPTTFHALQAALQAREAPTITQLYPTADHGFLDPARHPGEQNEMALRHAWPQTIAFLHAHLAAAAVATA